MKSLFLVAAMASAAAPAMAQGLRGVDPQGGLHWSVAAPQGASWTLDCRFRPVTVQGALTNQSTHTGSGPMRGRLPTDNGRCTLKKTADKGLSASPWSRTAKPPPTAPTTRPRPPSSTCSDAQIGLR